MTSEIVIMNSLAVALAADSAVTLFTGEKIYKTANKLFALTKFHPVGIMFFNNADINGIPWETIVKMYRRSLGKNSKDTIQDYFKDFINFLETDDILFPLERQRMEYQQILGSYLYTQRLQIDEIIETKLQQNKSISDDEIIEVFQEYIDQELIEWEELKNIDGIDNSFLEEIQEKFDDIFKELLDEIFQKYPIETEYYEKLKILSSYIFCKEENFETSFNSGVVITGFGEKQIFPSMISFRVKLFLNNKLIHCNIRTRNCNLDLSASINAFAQEEEVVKFIEGVGPEYRSFISGYIKTMFNSYPELLISQITNIDQTEKDRLLMEFNAETERFINEFHAEESRIVNTHVDPIIAVVNSLPKEELAVMAEMLVNLTSFKRKMSLDKETVGGPIDVAVISKGDGFIWIKRKHYFKPELNPQFFKK